MAVKLQAFSNTVSWDCYTSADNAHMHGYMHTFRVLAVYVQTSYAGFARKVTAQSCSAGGDWEFALPQ